MVLMTAASRPRSSRHRRWWQTPCATPGCNRPAITDDGPHAPCMVCVYRFGDAARRPTLLPEGTKLMLIEAHGDVVELVTSVLSPTRQWWRWKSS